MIRQRIPARRGIAVVLAGILLALACARDDAPPGSAEPRRIVSLYPSATEILFALGAGDRVVARGAWCDEPPEVLRLPALGDAAFVSAESVLALAPDLVLVASRSQEEALAPLAGRMRVERVGADRVRDVETLIRRLATLTGRRAEGERLVSRIEAALSDARRRAAGRKPVRVVFVVQREPLVVAGGRSYVGELLEAVGGVNVAADVPGLWPALSEEALVARRPEVILDGATTDPGAFWSRFPGLGRVERVTEKVVLRPGPRLPVALGILERRIREGPR